MRMEYGTFASINDESGGALPSRSFYDLGFNIEATEYRAVPQSNGVSQKLQADNSRYGYG